MASPAFKFTKDGVTRRVPLPSNASWLDIATKLATLYDIPLDRVAVSYIDADADEITISTQEELQDYYHARASDSDSIRFTVIDLQSLRADKPLPDPPQFRHSLHESASRNTFGAFPLSFESNDHWPAPFNIFTSPSDNVRFEELVSDGGSRKVPSVAGSGSGSTATAKPRSEASEDDVSSVDSVLANDTPIKPPVHVFNRSASHMSTASAENGPESRPAPPTSAPSTSAPPALAPPASSPDPIPDPPLPDLEPTRGGSHGPSLTNDVATLLGTIAAIFSSHPELAEGLRNISRNVGNGSYWAGHRERVAHAAAEIRRSTQDLHAHMAHAAAYSTDVEQHASRRIAETIGNIVRSLGEMAFDPNSHPVSSHQPEVDPATTWSAFDVDVPFLPPTRPGIQSVPRPPFNRPHPPHSHPHPPHSRPPRGPPHRPPHLPPHHPVHPPHLPHIPHLPHHPPHPPIHPPHLPDIPHPPHHPPHPPHLPFPFGPWGRPSGPMPPHNPSAFGSFGRPTYGASTSFRTELRQPPADIEAIFDISDDDISEEEDAEISIYGISPMLPPRAQKERVLAAKATYKAEKEKYLQERKARHRARERKRHLKTNVDESLDANKSTEPILGASSSAGPSGYDALTQLISHGRGPFPPLEHFSISRSQTIPGNRRARHEREASATTNTETSRARITRRLSDMGFDGSSVERRVSIHVSGNSIQEKSAEDSIISSVVEELLGDTSTSGTVNPRQESA